MKTERELYDEFDRLLSLTIARFTKRNRHRFILVRTVNDFNDKYADFRKEGRILKITLYKPSMIRFYMTNPITKNKSFKSFFIATIVHEFVHIDQCMRLFNGNFKLFKSAYDTYEKIKDKLNPNPFEFKAQQYELMVYKHFN